MTPRNQTLPIQQALQVVYFDLRRLRPWASLLHNYERNFLIPIQIIKPVSQITSLK